MRVVGQFSDRRATAPRGNALGARLAFLNLLLEILQEVLEELGFSVGLNRSLVICAAEFSFSVIDEPHHESTRGKPPKVL